ncbi:MAG: choice-of-anchor D domain-containing protein, partial [bacterium]
LQVQTIGNQTLTVTAVSSSSNRFVPRVTIFTIAAGEAYTLAVDFIPTSEGTISGYLQIQSNAANNANYQVYLTGYGFASYFSPATPTGLPYIIVLDSATVDNRGFQTGDQIAVFDGELCVGLTIFLEYPIQVTAWEGDPGNGLAGFTPGNPITFKVFVDAYEQWVELVPQVTWGQGNGTFGDGEFALARLKAYSGLEPVIEVNEAALEFSSTQVGGQTTLAFSVTNTGKSDLTINNIASTNSTFWASPTNFTLAPSSARQVTVTFQPSEAMPYSANLTIYSNAPNTPTVNINLTGQGLPAMVRSIQVSTTPIVFTATKIGATANANVTIINIGSVPLAITSVQFSNSCFSTTISSIEIAVGESYNLPIIFTPNVMGLVSGSISINNNSQNNPTPMINLSGTGYEGYFQPVEPTGIPYTIIIDSLITGDVFTPRVGDEIGIFDRDLCVGNIIMSSDTGDVSGTAWQADNSNNLPGFHHGNPITLRYYFLRDGDINLYSLAYEIVAGDGKFGTMPFSSFTVRIDKEILPPEAPLGLTAIGRKDKVILSWSANTESDLSKYWVYRGEQTNNYLLIDSINTFGDETIIFEDFTVNNGTTYFYRLTALDTAGNESDYSAEASATPYDGPVWYISTTGNDSLNNGSETAPFASIQHGINESINGDTVLVHPGTYVENINFNGKNIVVGSLFLTTQDTSYITQTIIDGNQNGSVVKIEGGEDSTALLYGFTVVNGVASQGGGVYCNANPTINHLIIRSNTADEGAGIFVTGWGNSPLVSNCIISNNQGHGIFLWDSPTKVYSTQITDNDNTGLQIYGGNTFDLINCTISNNNQGIVLGHSDQSPIIINTIVWDNKENQILFDENDHPMIYNSNIPNIIMPGNGNIQVPPRFIASEEENYGLSDYSYCIGAGIDSVQIDGTWYYAPIKDIDGNPRPNPAGSRPDIGAYENSRATPIDTIPPAIPQNLEIIDYLQAITIKWNASINTDLSHYNIYCANSPNFNTDSTYFKGKVFAPDTTYIDSLIQNNNTYYYKITAVDTIGNESDPSDELVITAIVVDIWDIAFKQRIDGSSLVDIYYSFSGNDTTQYEVIPYLSNFNDEAWGKLTLVSGDAGGVLPGDSRQITWNLKSEAPEMYSNNSTIKITIGLPSKGNQYDPLDEAKIQIDERIER